MACGAALWRRLPAALLVVLLLSGLSGQAARAQGSSREGAAPTPSAPVPKPLPRGSSLQFPAVTLVDGRVLPPEHWQGKVVVIERWATWCPFCARQNPNLNGLHLDHQGKGLEVLALSTDKSVQTVQAYLAKTGYKFHVAMMTPEWQARLGSSRTLPELWVIGRDGRVKEYVPGEMFPEDVAALSHWLQP